MTSMLTPEITLQLQLAARRLAAGRLVAFPTETVYGLGADAENPEAVSRLYAVKGRPAGHPVIVHLAPGSDIGYWAKSIPAQARDLIRNFWPGPLTIILQRADHISPVISGGQDSIGLRCPSHPIAQVLLRQFAALKPQGHGGLAAPSANKFGRVSPTTAAHVRDEFPELDSSDLMVLEGGPAKVGIESTIIDLSRLNRGAAPALLRPGGVSAAQVEAVLGIELSRRDELSPRVSGSLKAHYAPRTPLLLLSADQLRDLAEEAASGTERVAAVVFDPPREIRLLSVRWHVAPTDPHQYAHDLYALLRRLDEEGYARILIEHPPRTAAWQAVNDRLGRAAAAFQDQTPK